MAKLNDYNNYDNISQDVLQPVNFVTVTEVNNIVKNSSVIPGKGINIDDKTKEISVNIPISSGTGYNSTVEGNYTTATGECSHAEGESTSASGDYSHAEGSSTSASGDYSHAEGSSTSASGDYSHAEGNYTTASGECSHAEGNYTTASGECSHAEGDSTNANGYSSHAEGIFTITKNPSEHASGQYNLSSSASTTFGDSGNTLFSVGNGTNAAARTNAFEIRQNGDIYLSAYTNSAKTAFEYSKLQDKLVNIQTISENAESSMHIFSAITISAANSAINAATSAETIAEHPNVVGSNGNWWSYNISSSSYTDTGIVSVGVPDITISDDSSEGEIAITYGDGVIDFSEDTDGDITITY